MSTGNKLTLFMTLAVLGGFAIILLMNVASIFGYIPPKFISPNDVRGSGVEHNKVMYTLNFEQQNLLVDIINRLIPVTVENVEARKTTIENPAEVQKIIIYRFNAPDLVLTPKGYISKSSSIVANEDRSSARMVLSAPALNPNGLLEVAALDDLNTLLLQAYDTKNGDTKNSDTKNKEKKEEVGSPKEIPLEKVNSSK